MEKRKRRGKHIDPHTHTHTFWKKEKEETDEME